MTKPLTITDLSSIRMIVCYGIHEHLLRSLNPRRPNKPS